MNAPRPPAVLVVAKAPVPGWAKTRLAATIGDTAAAELAAASLLDTLDAALGTRLPVVVALTGELGRARRLSELTGLLARCRVLPQRGAGLPARLANAHHDARVLLNDREEPGGGRVLVQIGMDTPQVRPADLRAAAAAAGASVAALGPAPDGGWWALALGDPDAAGRLAAVATSTSSTSARTAAALRSAGLRVTWLPAMRDVDVQGDIAPVALACGAGSRFRRAALRSAPAIGVAS